MKLLTVTNRCFLYPPITVEVGDEMAMLKFNETREFQSDSNSELPIHVHMGNRSGSRTISLTQDREVKISRRVRDSFYCVMLVVMVVAFIATLLDAAHPLHLSARCSQ